MTLTSPLGRDGKLLSIHSGRDAAPANDQAGHLAGCEQAIAAHAVLQRRVARIVPPPGPPPLASMAAWTCWSPGRAVRSSRPPRPCQARSKPRLDITVATQAVVPAAGAASCRAHPEKENLIAVTTRRGIRRPACDRHRIKGKAHLGPDASTALA